MSPGAWTDPEQPARPPSCVFGPYDTGAGYAYADPFRVQRLIDQMLGGPKYVQDLIARGKSPDPSISRPASEEFFLGVIAALDIVPFNKQTGQGANEQTIVAVWNGWNEWCRQKKTTGGGSPITSNPTTSGPSPSESPQAPWLSKSISPLAS